MNARDAIARGLVGCGLRDRDLETWADEILTQLAFDGYRILGPDELDPVTVERCALRARECFDDPQAETDANYVPSAIRSLSPEAPQPEAKEARRED